MGIWRKKKFNTKGNATSTFTSMYTSVIGINIHRYCRFCSVIFFVLCTQQWVSKRYNIDGYCRQWFPFICRSRPICQDHNKYTAVNDFINAYPPTLSKLFTYRDTASNTFFLHTRTHTHTHTTKFYVKIVYLQENTLQAMLSVYTHISNSLSCLVHRDTAVSTF